VFAGFNSSNCSFILVSLASSITANSPPNLSTISTALFPCCPLIISSISLIISARFSNKLSLLYAILFTCSTIASIFLLNLLASFIMASELAFSLTNLRVKLPSRSISSFIFLTKYYTALVVYFFQPLPFDFLDVLKFHSYLAALNKLLNFV